MKKQKAAGGAGSSTAALEKAKKLLEVERKRASELASKVVRLEAMVKQRDKEIKTATTRKRQAVDDMDRMKVEIRGLEQRIKDLDALLATEKESRSADLLKFEGDLKDLQAANDAAQATLKEYQDGESARSDEVRKAFVRSDEFGEKFTDKISLTFEEAIKAAVDYLKTKDHLPAELTIPPEDLANVMGAIPDALFDFDA